MIEKKRIIKKKKVAFVVNLFILLYLFFFSYIYILYNYNINLIFIYLNIFTHLEN